MKTLTEQLACVRRELAVRKNVYPAWVRTGRMAKEKAHHEIECMASVVETIEKMKNLEEVSNEIKADLARGTTAGEARDP